MQRRTFLGGSGAIIVSPIWSSDAIAQKPIKLPVIGYLSSVSPGPSDSYVATFREGLSERGYVEGQNVLIEYRRAEGPNDRLPALADLVARKVDVIVTQGGDSFDP